MWNVVVALHVCCTVIHDSSYSLGSSIYAVQVCNHSAVCHIYRGDSKYLCWMVARPTTLFLLRRRSIAMNAVHYESMNENKRVTSLDRFWVATLWSRHSHGDAVLLKYIHERCCSAEIYALAMLFCWSL